MIGRVMASPLVPPNVTRVAVVTVSYGSEKVLPSFLESLPASSASPIDIVVADNKAQGSDDVSRLASAHAAQYLPMPTNVGYGAAMNAAIASLPSTIEWVLIANPDLVVGAGALDALVSVGEEDALIGSVGPATLTSGGEIYPSARAVPSLRTGVGHALFSNLWIGNPWTRAYRHDTSTPHRRDAGWLSGACVLVRRSAFDDVGGFDPGYFMYFEDVDLGYRLGKQGYRNVYEPAAVVTHTGAHSTTTESGAMISAHHESARRFLKKKYSGPVLWPVRAVLNVGLTVRSALVRRKATHG